MRSAIQPSLGSRRGSSVVMASRQRGVITITREGDSLWARIGELNYQPFAEGRQEFFMKAVEAQVAFTVDSSGNITGLTLRYGNRTVTAQKHP